MSNKNLYMQKINNYKKYVRILNCANYIYLDELHNFEFKKISKYTKSKYMYDKVIMDFELVNELIDNKDLLNAATILRTLYENIIYIIATSYNKDFIIDLDILPGKFREVLENNCNNIFTDYFKKEDFNNIYKFLCKVIHPCSLKEFASYMCKTNKFRDYLLNNLKYLMIIIEYMYLNFLNKKIKVEESQLDINFIDLCTCVNIVNINYFLDDIKDNNYVLKKYYYYDENNKYILENQEKIKEESKSINCDEKMLNEYINDLSRRIDEQLRNSKYQETILNILKDK